MRVMKLSKRATSFVLLAAILTLFSCGEEAPDNIPEETTVPSTETAQPTDGLPDTDMGGFSFNILHHNKNWLTWAETQLVAEAFYNTLITGAGIKYFRMDKDNYPYFDVPGNEKTISFFEKLVRTVSANPDIYYDDNDGVDGGNVDKFPNGQILFQQAGVFGITNQRYREMKADFGILPAPKYDENQDKYYSYTNIGEIATLPRSYDTSRAENIGILMEAMSFYSQQNIVDTYKKVILQTKMTRDDDSSEMLQYIFDGISFDYGIVVWQNDIGNVFMKQVFKPKSDTVASTVDTIKTSLEAKIEELKTAVVDMP